MAERRFVLAITGGSGVSYGRRLLDCLAATGAVVHLVVSEAGQKVLNHELQLPLDLNDGPGVIRGLLGHDAPNVEYHHYKDLEVSIASGSYKTDGMAIVPCSGGTLGRIACGASSNLIERAAEVCLKERRKLILVPRETPYSEIMIENMLRVTRAGAIVLPASPGFYAGETRIEQVIDFIVSRVLDQLGVENALMQRYGEPARRRHPEDE
ncbi:MAG: UbiX family flavin prenyltransferase [Planctomycetaceae bacterium]|nr:UbiX family flavin prenyltransferase [Planctomycetaceae bacterium]